MKRTIITCCAFLCYVTLAAQPASTDSLLMRYRQMALEYNDDLKAAVRNIEASMELERAARAREIRNEVDRAVDRSGDPAAELRRDWRRGL